MKILSCLLPITLFTASALAQTPAPTAKSTPAPIPAPTPAGIGKAGGAPTPPAKRIPLKYIPLEYTPPKNALAGSRIDGDGGSRGSGAKQPSLYVLAPNHVGLTTRAQPCLFWYQTGPATTRFDLTVVEPKKPKPLLRVGTDKVEQPGIHRILLSKYNVTLTPGIIYRWSIALVPDPASRSQDIIASGTIQHAEPDAPVTTALASAQGEDKAALYAGKGFWYDALEAVTNQIDTAPKNRELRLQRAGLLEQAGLKDAATSERK
jgi:hypothetical protein